MTLPVWDRDDNKEEETEDILKKTILNSSTLMQTPRFATYKDDVERRSAVTFRFTRHVCVVPLAQTRRTGHGSFTAPRSVRFYRSRVDPFGPDLLSSFRKIPADSGDTTGPDFDDYRRKALRGN